MRKTIKIIFFATAVFAIALGDGLAQTNIVSSSTLPLYGQIENQLLMFETNKSAESIRQLDHSIDFLRSSQISHRKEPMRIWLEVLTMIDNNLDTNYDITAPHFGWVVRPPPDGTNGIQYPPGIAPEALKDPVARFNYEAAIRANNENAKKSALQIALLRLNENASSSFEEFLKSAYTSSQIDKKEIGEMLGKAELSSARKQKISRIMGLSSEVPPNK